MSPPDAPPPATATAKPAATSAEPVASTAQRLREASQALHQQRRRTLASAVALLVTLSIWSGALVFHGRYGSLLLVSHPRLLAPLLGLALVGAFPAGMLVRHWML